jgi:hypothetical protein
VTTWETVESGGGRKTVFHLDGEAYRAGAASTRCFEDLLAQRGERGALRAVERATQARGPKMHGLELVVEQLLQGAGVPSVPDLIAADGSDR